MGIEPTQDASQRPANGFEDRALNIRGRSQPAVQAQKLFSRVHLGPRLAVDNRDVGCHLGCRPT